MEGNSNSHLYNQDSLAAEMLKKLQNGSGFTTVAIPEGLALQQSHPSTSFSALNSSLLPQDQPISQTSASSDGIMLGAGSSLDPALTQLLVAAQAGNLAVSGISNSNVSADLPSNVPVTVASVLSGSLPDSSDPVNSEMIVPTELVPSASVPSCESMTITVHCSTSDTVIVVGQQNWQCCMCRETCGFDASVDHHLSAKHNLCLKPVIGESKFPSNENAVTTVAAQTDNQLCTENKRECSPAEPLQTISESALASLHNTDSSNSRTGLEREVALLMAQTFTHSGNIDFMAEECKTAESPDRPSWEKSKHTSVDCSLEKEAKIAADLKSCPRVDGEICVNVYANMISKVERAILCTVDSVTKNDLLLVATELSRMQKDLTSKRRQMKKSHRYISCPVCGKEVRNRKDLIKQHNRCHEISKKYRCLICNKLFKYMHTLRRHVVQQGHEGGLPRNSNDDLLPDLDGSELITPEQVTFDQLVKFEADVNNSEQECIKSGLDSHRSGTVGEHLERKEVNRQEAGEPAYEKILVTLLAKGEECRTSTGRKQSLVQCFVCDREIRNRNYYITRHARCHIQDLCYTCSFCGEEFYRSDYYKKHMAQHSSISVLEENPEIMYSSKESKSKATQEDVTRTDGSKSRLKKRVTDTSKSTTVSCKICGKNIFNRTYNIKRHARQHSIVEWESILRSPNQSQSKSSASVHHFLLCGLCGICFPNYSKKRQHMLKHRSSFHCRQCGAKFESGAELLAHNQNKKKTGRCSGPAIVSSQLTRPAGGPFSDASDKSGPDDNRSSTSSATSTQQGVRGPTWRKQATGQISTSQKWSCPICKANIIHSLQNISRHMRELHSEGQPHACPKCNRTYMSYHKMQRHFKSHGDSGGICDVCGKVFQTKAALRSHTKLHASPEGMFQCPKCPTSFHFQSRLEKHMRKHDERTEACPHCGKVYISKIHLKRHISVDHLGVKDYRFKCDQCSAQFFEHIQLRDHIAYRHQGVQIYTCKYCHKGFNCRPTLVRHERKVHTHYLPYKCKHCSQCFAEKSKLVAHEMTHTGTSPYKCDVCGKYFTSGGALRTHKRLHVDEKPFECGVCGKTYLKSWHLQQHMRKTHQAVEVMVYNLTDQTQQPGGSQQNILSVVEQSSCLQTAEANFIQVPVQGEYIHVQSVEGQKLK